MNLCWNCRKEFNGYSIQTYCSYECAPFLERHKWIIILIPVIAVASMAYGLSKEYSNWFWLLIPAYLAFVKWMHKIWWREHRSFRIPEDWNGEEII